MQEYIKRVNLLRKKIEHLMRLDREGELTPGLSDLMKKLNTDNQELQEQIENIARAEKQLLMEAQMLL